MNKLKTIAITLGCAAVATTAIAVAGTNSTSLKLPGTAKRSNLLRKWLRPLGRGLFV